MKDENKTKDQLIYELKALRQLVFDFERSDDQGNTDEKGHNKGEVEAVSEFNNHKQAEKPAIDPEALYYSFINNRDESIWSIDTHNRLQTFNKKFEEDYLAAYGIKLERGMHILDTLSGERKKIWKVKHDKVLGGEKEVFQFSENILGKENHYMVMLSPIYIDQKVAGASAISINITEQKKVEAALRESEAKLKQNEERLKLALYAANDGLWDWRMPENITFFDDRYYTMAGYEPNEFPAAFEEWEKRVHPDDMESTKRNVGNCLAGKSESYSSEFRFLRKDGSYMWILGKGKVVNRDNAGNITRFIGTHSDISELKRAEEAIKEKDRFHKAVLDDMMTFVAVLNPKGDVIFVNNTPLTIAGIGLEDVKGQKFYDAYWWSYSDKTKEVIKHDIEQCALGKSRVHDIRIRTNDGSLMWIEFNMHPIFDEFGTVQYLIPEGRDITDRKHAEQALRKAQNDIANIINSMPSVLVGVDKDGRVTQWNSEAQRVTGVGPDAALGHPLEQAFPRLTTKMQRVREAMETRQVRSGLRQVGNEDGRTRYEDVTIYPLTSNGVEGAVIRIDNVTEKVRMEEMMIQSEKMLSVGGLAAGMAHEINNPLAGMMQTAGVMAGRLGNNFHIPANRKAAEAAGTTLTAIERFMKARGIPRMLDTINASGKRVAAIVDNMLSFARKGEAAVSSHALDELLDKTLELAATDYDLKKQYDFKRIQIHREYADDLPVVPCEGAKIQQVLLNIFRNGAQAMQEAGTQSPRFMVRTRFEKERQMVRMDIRDNGPGMDEKIRKRVFEPFFTTKPMGAGTGLGLSVSYFIITENHRGEMAVESRPGAGATFIVRLPVKGK